MSEPRVPPDGDDLLAAEFALGLLQDDEVLAAEAKANDDPAFAKMLYQWRVHLSDLIDSEASIDEVPSAAVWSSVAAVVFGSELDNLALLRRSLGRWRAAALTMSAASAMLMAVLLAGPLKAPSPAVPQPQLIALLGSEAAQTVGAVTYDAANQRLTIWMDHLRTGGRVPELWIIGEDGQPRSLGIINKADAWSLVVPSKAAELLNREATLAVSLEPTGGSPFKKPTGPVILSGKLI